MTAACDVPCVNNRAASNRRASNAALRRCPCCGVVMPQHRMVPDDNHHFISRDSLALAVSLLAAPFAAEAQQGERVYRIGLLSEGAHPLSKPLADALRELGWTE